MPPAQNHYPLTVIHYPISISPSNTVAAGPVIVFSILEYAFHVPTWISVIAAIGAPIALFILFALTTEQLSAFTNKKN